MVQSHIAFFACSVFRCGAFGCNCDAPMAPQSGKEHSGVVGYARARRRKGSIKSDGHAFIYSTATASRSRGRRATNFTKSDNRTVWNVGFSLPPGRQLEVA